MHSLRDFILLDLLADPHLVAVGVQVNPEVELAAAFAGVLTIGDFAVVLAEDHARCQKDKAT